MPFIQVLTNAELTRDDERKIKTALARVLEDVAKKPEQWLMVHIQGSQALFFQGSHEQRNAYMEVKYIGSFTNAVREQVVKAAAKILKEVAAVSPDRLYVHFDESGGSDWGWNNSLFG